jgi:hypothetical protein
VPGEQPLQVLGHGLALDPGGRDDHLDPGADHLGGEQWIESTPLAGGPITAIGPGDMPAISPDGRLLAYLAWTVKIYPPNTPARDMTSVPEAIVVRNLQTGTVRRWAFTSDVPAISSLSWSEQQPPTVPKNLQRPIARHRNRVETSLKEVTGQMELARHGAHTFEGLLTRTVATLATHTLLLTLPQSNLTGNRNSYNAPKRLRCLPYRDWLFQ